MRVAWFTPLPPDPSGVAAYSQEVTPLLAPRLGALDLYADGPAQEFVWRHRRQPYDLIVYQLGNSASHDFIWAYLFRYPGLLVLHDAQVHQARALWLLRRLEPRLDDYLAELRANHPGAPAELGWLFAAGLGGNLFRLWPLVSLAIGASRLTAVHNTHLARALAQAHPDAAITAIEMGVADPLEGGDSVNADARALRTRLGIPSDACVVGAYGGITPEKRIPELLKAVAAQPPAMPPMYVLLVGQRAPHYDVDADVRALGLEARVHIAGYVPDAELPAWMAAADVCCCLRWPSNGETSASWLRCLGAGRPTLVTALAQMQDVPLAPGGDAAQTAVRMPDAIGVAIDPLDEPRELPRVLASLAASPAARQTLGGNARAWWAGHHTLPRMADGYERLMREAAARPAPACALPAHLVDDGTGTARRILGEMGMGAPTW